MLSSTARKLSASPAAAAEAAAEITISTIEEANAATIECARARRRCERLQREFDDAVIALYTIFQTEFAPHQARATANEDAVVAFARTALEAENAQSPKPSKTFKLGFGAVKFTRDGDRVVVRVPMPQLIANLRRLRLARFVKRREYVDSGDLRQIAPELRERLGVAIEPTPVLGKLDIDTLKLAAVPEFAKA
jgi:phage host-nuclease inhibitor protein Gam